jgi:hypothetical protein
MRRVCQRSVSKRGTKKPKRTDTIHQAVQGTGPVIMKTTKMNLRMNDPNLATVAEERDEHALEEEDIVAEHSPAHLDDLFQNIPDFSKGLPAQNELEECDKQMREKEKEMRSPSNTQEAMDNVMEEYNLKNLERPGDMEGIELSDGASVKSGDNTFYIGNEDVPPLDDDHYDQIIFDNTPVFNPNTIPQLSIDDFIEDALGPSKIPTNPEAENTRLTERAKSPIAPSLDLKKNEDHKTEMKRQLSPTKLDTIDNFIEDALGLKTTNIKPEAENTCPTKRAKSPIGPSLDLKNNEDQKTPKKRQLSPTKSDPSWTPKRHQRSPKKVTDVVNTTPRITRSASESTIQHAQPERTRTEEPQIETKETEDTITPSASAQTKVVTEEKKTQELVPKLLQQAEATEKKDEKVKASGAPVTKVLHQPTLSSMLKRKTDPK